MIIALDGMGGDRAPETPVAGALAALAEFPDLELLLTGDPAALKTELQRQGGIPDRLEIVPAGSVVTMKDPPTQALKEKRDSSITVAVNLVREGRARALVSAGNTGAQMAASLIMLGRIKGISRPALGSFLPTTDPQRTTFLLDVGANSDVKPENLLEFGVMADVFLRIMKKEADPTIGLLSIGEESSKGNETTVAANELMRRRRLFNFAGNVEGRDILRGTTNAVVCDGFVGNIILKFAETIQDLLRHKLTNALKLEKADAGALETVGRAFARLQKEFNYEEYGGVPLLGINGISVITHGAATPKALKNSIREAVRMTENKLVDHIASGIAKGA